MKHKWMRWCVTVGALGVAIAHFVWPTAAIDAVTAMLLLTAIIPWLQPLFKSLELPGGVKIEFQDLERITERADGVGLLATPSPPTSPPPYSFLAVAASDPNLALAGLRIELERRLEQLARSRGDAEIPHGIGPLLRFLNQRERINGSERVVLSELVGLLNSAVHGAQVDSEASQWALEVGPRILQALDQRATSRDVRYEGIIPRH
jgi:hypothetical protein